MSDLIHNTGCPYLYTIRGVKSYTLYRVSELRYSLGFLSKSLVFFRKMSERAICPKKRAICSFLVSDLTCCLSFKIAMYEDWYYRLKGREKNTFVPLVPF